MSDSKKIHNAVRKILRNTCICYTVLVLALCFILLWGASAPIYPSSFLLMFPFALCFCIASQAHQSKRIPSLLKFVIHFVLTVGGFFCFMYLPAFSDSSESMSMVVFTVFVLCYLVTYGLIMLFRKRWKKEFGPEPEYTPLYSSKKNSENDRKSEKHR